MEHPLQSHTTPISPQSERNLDLEFDRYFLREAPNYEYEQHFGNWYQIMGAPFNIAEPKQRLEKQKMPAFDFEFNCRKLQNTNFDVKPFNAFLYLTLREQGSSRSEALGFSSRVKCKVDTTLQKDGPVNNRVLNRIDNQKDGPTLRGWQFHQANYDLGKLNEINKLPDSEYEVIEKKFRNIQITNKNIAQNFVAFPVNEEQDTREVLEELSPKFSSMNEKDLYKQLKKHNKNADPLIKQKVNNYMTAQNSTCNSPIWAKTPNVDDKSYKMKRMFSKNQFFIKAHPQTQLYRQGNLQVPKGENLHIKVPSNDIELTETLASSVDNQSEELSTQITSGSRNQRIAKIKINLNEIDDLISVNDAKSSSPTKIKYGYDNPAVMNQMMKHNKKNVKRSSVQQDELEVELNKEIIEEQKEEKSKFIFKETNVQPKRKKLSSPSDQVTSIDENSQSSPYDTHAKSQNFQQTIKNVNLKIKKISIQQPEKVNQQSSRQEKQDHQIQILRYPVRKQKRMKTHFNVPQQLSYDSSALDYNLLKRQKSENLIQQQETPTLTFQSLSVKFGNRYEELFTSNIINEDLVVWNQGKGQYPKIKKTEIKRNLWMDQFIKEMNVGKPQKYHKNDFLYRETRQKTFNDLKKMNSQDIKGTKSLSPFERKQMLSKDKQENKRNYLTIEKVKENIRVKQENKQSQKEKKLRKMNLIFGGKSNFKQEKFPKISVKNYY